MMALTTFPVVEICSVCFSRMYLDKWKCSTMKIRFLNIFSVFSRRSPALLRRLLVIWIWTLQNLAHLEVYFASLLPKSLNATDFYCWNLQKFTMDHQTWFCFRILNIDNFEPWIPGAPTQLEPPKSGHEWQDVHHRRLDERHNLL